MDPITHGIIGLGLSTLSGEPVNSLNPLMLGSVIGAMAPDIDIVFRLKGQYEYLKHHRGITHSIVGISFISIAISVVLNLIFRDYSFFRIFIWTFLGSLSHSVFDMLNSYGARFLLPFTKRKISASLLMLFDPVIIFLSLGMVFLFKDIFMKEIVFSLIFAIYLLFRIHMRSNVAKVLYNNFKNKCIIEKINILPSFFNPLKWDFIVETKDSNIVGQVYFLNKKITIRRKLKKVNHKIIKQFYKTELGRYFSEFTPIKHVKVIDKGEEIILRIIDLRYYLRNEFMHHATAVFNLEKKMVRTIFHPYSLRREILVEEKEIA
ncbi:hydrolase [Caloranaerobacter azorensis H53214]|uniref:Hydrolase n=1 Tax=Caloranaerobacter azorensis H53214 TaxID=1156417 RepID=A0A096BJ47_9FIRM|nr:metal-dependent hydrolase [Caloranaerobacter azorensis]KGG81210.1 hydrolase [Caloranaerobacter azorensis H53214]